MDLSQVDIYNPDNFVASWPEEMFRTLRLQAPVYFHPEPHGPGFWALTKYDDVLTVSRDSSAFSSYRGGWLIDDSPPDELENMRLLMISKDPPEHTKLRNIVNKGFTPRMVARLEERIRGVCEELVEKAVAKGECDFVTTVAAELPLQVIVEMLGVPQADRHKVFDWSNRLIGFDDPEYQTSHEDAQVVSAEMYAYANQLALERKAHPSEDLISILVEAEVDGHRLTELEFDLFFILLTVAGNETTRNSISGGMLAMIENPGELDRLIADPSLGPTATEEVIRWVSPVMYFRRTATKDVELRGQLVRRGQKVAMYYGSANRDEEAFAEPDRFDVGRHPNEHVAFGGGGTHFCLGANLARLEIRVLFEELVKRVSGAELTGPVRRLRSNFINGIKEMPVRFS